MRVENAGRHSDLRIIIIKNALSKLVIEFVEPESDLTMGRHSLPGIDLLQENIQRYTMDQNVPPSGRRIQHPVGLRITTPAV